MVQYNNLFVLLFIILNIGIIGARQCNSTDLVSQQCTENETCLTKTKICECLPQFKRVNGKCENMTKESMASQSSALTNENNGSNILVGILIPLSLVFVVIFGIYISKKYEVIFWIRSKLKKRNNYDEVMIGQDDDDDDLPLQD